jgi:hypothetical protein
MQYKGLIVALTLYGQCIAINLRNKDKPDAFSFLIYFNNNPVHVSNRLFILRRQFTVYPVYCIYHASTLTSC